MKPEWKIRMYQEGDEIGIVNLMNLVMPRSAYKMNRWLWEYKNNPYGYLIVVAEHNGNIVGHMGLFLIEIKVGNKIIMGSQACDLCVHPDFRRQGMFLAIGKALMRKASDEGVFLTYGFPNEPAYYGHIKYGWFDVFKIPNAFIYFNTYNALIKKYEKLRRIENLTKPLSKILDYYFLKCTRTLQRDFLSINNIKISKVSYLDENINKFWCNVSKDYDIIVVRNSKYLNWRFFDRPNVDYDVFLAEKAGQIEGYLVSTTSKSERMKSGWIVDVLSTSEDVFLKLICIAIEHLIKQSVDSIECLMPKNHVWYKTLKKTGFLFLHPLRKRFIARINSPQFIQAYKKEKEWYVTYGDSDWM